jgi:FkbM family methyltransferase
MYFLKKIFSYKKNINNNYDQIISFHERKRIKSIPRYTETFSYLFGKKIRINDSISYLSSLNEIFFDEIYKFKSNSNNPIIIDCGANIGLATIYFKINYPQGIIYSFEADPYIFECLKFNINSFEHNSHNVKLLNNAVSTNNENVFFLQEGGHSGMLVSNLGKNVIEINAVSLKNYLKNFSCIDFLKIDIEGHEINVFPDIEDQLYKISHIFIEYHSFLNKNQELSIILNILEKNKFRYYIKEGYKKKYPYLEKEIFLEMDLLINIFCYK